MTSADQMTRSRLAQFVHLAHNRWSYVGLFQ